MNKQNNIKICLLELSDKDQAAVERVIKFSTSQGKQYALWGEIEHADILVANDSASLGEQSAIVIRVGEQAVESDGLVLAPPLLVSRVMRVIDKAASMLDSTTAEIETDTEGLQSAIAEGTTATDDKLEIAGDTTSPEKIQIAAEKHEVNAAAGRAEAKVVEKLKTKKESVIAEKAKPAELLKVKDKAERVEDINIRNTPEAETKPEAGEKAEDKTDKGSEQFTALVVDDSAAIRKQLELELRIAKINAEFAETGEEALEKSAQKNYDLVFLDIVMPGIDGYEVCKQMRLRESMKKTPIVMLSGKTSPLDEVQGVIAGASTYLTKPVKHEMFQKTLNRLSTWLSDYSRLGKTA